MKKFLAKLWQIANWPSVKRFLKVAGAAALTWVVAYVTAHFADFNLPVWSEGAIIGLLMAIEKKLNLW